jgi:uncharacterized protein YndB with AHSA1/START domain
MASNEIRIEWRFPAARETVFGAWMDAEEIAEWFAAPPFVVTDTVWAPREGEAWQVHFRSPDGWTYREAGSFLEVRPPERLVFSLTQIGLPDPGPETIVSVIFEAVSAAETVMHFRQTGFTSAALRDGNEGGWRECFTSLESHLRIVGA